jgi:uncharacterized protein (DUF1800 family)
VRRLAVILPVLIATAIASAVQPSTTDDAAIVHVLNRVGFGPAPGDVERLRRIGVPAYIEEQLHPERIADPSVHDRLAGLTTLRSSTADLLQQFQQPLAQARRERQPQGAVQGNSERPARRTMPSREVQPNLPVVELSQQKLLRAVYSDRQLEEVLTDFWFNHFNVDARKGPVRFMVTEYERDAIRPFVLGRFRDLLGATAKSPAMLFYLDNWMSGAEQGGPARSGLNENYARELMELHTLGVDGGYTQKDVTEVARAFTGWTIENPRMRGTFRFEPRLHAAGVKTILGHRIDAGGVKDGEEVLDILAAHPSTARFISTKLARRFVSDTPPAALVARLSARFTATRGDLKEVMRALLVSPEFLSPSSHGTKIKTPFEYVVSAIRASGQGLANARPAVRSLQQLGMPLYQCQPPTGYKDTADAWVNTGALVNRMNFAVTWSSAESGPGQLRRRRQASPASVEDVLTGVPVSDATRATIEKASTPQQALALALGSPEFQRR